MEIAPKSVYIGGGTIDGLRNYIGGTDWNPLHGCP